MNGNIYDKSSKGAFDFVKELGRPEQLRAKWTQMNLPGENHLDLQKGIQFECKFPDPEKLLKSAYDELQCFFVDAGIPVDNGKIRLSVRQVNDLSGEAFRIRVEKQAVFLESGSMEGVRRAVYHLEEKLLSSDGPYLVYGSEEKTPWLVNRISRCFFGPIKRPPFNVDELMNDLDYYPEAYLARLAREGINGLWLTVVFHEICRTSLLPENPNAEQRRSKLRRVVEKCRQYGIKIWLFCIEPHCWDKNLPCPDKHPELKSRRITPGAALDQIPFCPASEIAQRYLYECTNSLFKEVSHLGGLITISWGERTTSCLSTIGQYENQADNPCGGQHCRKTIPEILAAILNPLERGMKDAAPEADLISWIYQVMGDWQYELPDHLHSSQILACNFEVGIQQKQLNSTRISGDYWLSAIGPSDKFGRMALACKGKCQIAAKLQVCCSHELASIPYIPVPGNLYHKFRAMQKLGVQHAILCWYFGNYPGLMNRAAGHLAFEDLNTLSESAFLQKLAARDWHQNAQIMPDIWRQFSKAYENYPLDNIFQYYGPMHDGPVWPLYLKQNFRPLTRSWMPDQEAPGDAIGEAFSSFSLDEAAFLCRRLADLWSQAMKRFESIMQGHADSDACNKEFLLCRALEILFYSGANILNFYSLRRRLIAGGSLPKTSGFLAKMREIVATEIVGSRTLAMLCHADPRLGFHSEAGVFKFYPEKLEWRAKQLELLLAVEFPKIEVGLSRNILPEELLTGEDAAIHHEDKEYISGGISWRYSSDIDQVRFYLEFVSPACEGIEWVYLLLCDSHAAEAINQPFCFSHDKTQGKSGFNLYEWTQGCIRAQFESAPAGWNAEITVPRLFTGNTFRFGIRRNFFCGEESGVDSYPESENWPVRLALNFFRADKTVPVCPNWQQHGLMGNNCQSGLGRKRGSGLKPAGATQTEV